MTKKHNIPVHDLPSQQQIDLLVTSIQNSDNNAFQLLIELLEDYPRYGLGWKMAGYMAEQSGDLEVAQMSYQKALELIPEDFELNFNLGNVYLAKSEFNLALNLFLVATQMQPDFYEAYLNVVVALTSLNRLEEAKEILSLVSEVHGDKEATRQVVAKQYFMLGQAYKIDGHRNFAEECFLKAVKYSPDFNEAQITLAGFYLKEQSILVSEKVRT